MPKQIRIETGPGHYLVVCECGWRELCFTEREIQGQVAWHKEQVHGDSRGASMYAAKRRQRS